jgi:hypothetical protein
VEHPDFISDVEVGVVEIDAVGVGIGYVWGDESSMGVSGAYSNLKCVIVADSDSHSDQGEGEGWSMVRSRSDSENRAVVASSAPGAIREDPDIVLLAEDEKEI